jgi:hypothetical protein
VKSDLIEEWVSGQCSFWRMPSSGMWRRLDLVWTDVPEKRIASIFMVEKSASEEPTWAGGCRLSHQSKTCRLQLPAHAGSSLANFSTLKIEVILSSETSVHTRSKRRHIPEDGILHSHRRENLKSYNVRFIQFVQVMHKMITSLLS